MSDTQISTLDKTILDLINVPAAICTREGDILHANASFQTTILKGTSHSDYALVDLVSENTCNSLQNFLAHPSPAPLVLNNAELIDTRSYSHKGKLTLNFSDNHIICKFEFGNTNPTDNLVTLNGSEIVEFILNAIPAPAYFKDTAHRYRACNQAFLDFYDRKREDVIGFTAHDLVSKELADQFQYFDNEIFDTGEVQIEESINESSSGEIKNVIFQKTALKDKIGNVQGIIGIVLDVTETRKTEKELEYSKMIFQGIVENSPAHIFVKDAE
ncbi:PAS domain-containing protein [Sneathiella glossodoripedis]|uniref:PAS domain-containing protein n=1 Tax=Sneathiella glossodoripedis TaxID=418853 RepID=UPI00047044F8|nr:PAS domain-containing protein [Sneathiella glossodoripedis]